MRATVAALLLLNLFVEGVVAQSLRRSWQLRQEQAALSTQGLARLLERSLGAIFDKVDLALLAVQDEHARQLAAGTLDGVALDAVLARHKARAPDLIGLRLSDASGRVILGAPASDEHVQVDDRDFFFVHRDQPDAGLYISRPSMGRIVKVPIILLSRRLATPDGRFAGVVIGTISLEHIASLLGEVEVGPHGAALLRSQDLSIVVRRSNGALGPFLQPSPPSAALRSQVQAGLTSGGYVTEAPWDGVERTYGWRKVGTHPFYAVVGVAQADLLAPWWNEAAQAAGLALLFGAVTALGGWFALRSLRRQQRAAVALQESEARLAATVAALPDALAITDLEAGRYLLVNEGFARVAGRPVAEVVGRTSAEIDVWDDRADRAAVVEALAARGAVEDYEAVFRRRDGTRFTGAMSARIIAIEGTRYLLSITRDLTQQRRLEAQLQQAQRLESVGRLAGGVAHDFNNMLSVILGEAAVLAAGLPPDHPAQESVREIVHAGERSRDLTRQLLAFSRKQAISPRVVGLDALLEAARPTLLRLLGEDVALAFEPAVDLGTVRLDPGQFDQVLVNLAANARDAMPRGGRLTLRTAGVTLDAARPPALQALPPGGYALLTVSDDGQGMDAETLAHLFEPFFTTKAAGKGTGLGLATAYGIVRQSGGAILVASAPGQGTTFSIYLPCCGDAADPLPAAAGAGPARGQGHVLLVEDEAPVRRTTRKLLESLGYRVQEAASGEEALARAGQARFDLLISDVMMPGLKGPELAQRLQALQPGLPTLLISGYAASVIGDQGVLEPGLHFLQKPFTLHDLAAKVREALPDVAAPPASG